jgi:hypothetical protein
VCIRPGIGRWHAPGSGLKTVGDSGAVVSRATEGQALGSFKNLLSVARENAGLEILVHGTQCETHPYYMCLPFPQMGDACNKGTSRISLKRETGS